MSDFFMGYDVRRVNCPPGRSTRCSRARSATRVLMRARIRGMGGSCAEYVYQFEAAHEFEELDQNELKLSALVWLDDSRLLALERTDLVARLYLLDLAKATDILG